MDKRAPKGCPIHEKALALQREARAFLKENPDSEFKIDTSKLPEDESDLLYKRLRSVCHNSSRTFRPRPMWNKDGLVMVIVKDEPT